MQRDQLGVAVIGCGRIGTLRASLASRYPGVGFLAVSDAEQHRADILARRGEVKQQLALCLCDCQRLRGDQVGRRSLSISPRWKHGVKLHRQSQRLQEEWGRE